jgi:hypothetical protein
MIISASRRTDIPAFYASWFMNRIRDGFVQTRNPFHPAQISRIRLDPTNVDAIVFWTRNAEPLAPFLNQLDRLGYRYYFQYTLVHYPQIFERSPVPLPQKVDRFRRLSHRVGRGRIIWRYDPIILSSVTDLKYHHRRFQEIAESLTGHTQRCVISFLDIYQKTKRLLDKLKKETGVEIVDIHHCESKIGEISRVFSEVGKNCGLEIVTCAEPFDLEDVGIRHGKCIDDGLLNKIFGLNLSLPRDKGQRKECGCVESRDIGAYDTCPYGCLYCYANSRLELARRNFDSHRTDAPMLPGAIGWISGVS